MSQSTMRLLSGQRCHMSFYLLLIMGLLLNCGKKWKAEVHSQMKWRRSVPTRGCGNQNMRLEVSPLTFATTFWSRVVAYRMSSRNKGMKVISVFIPQMRAVYHLLFLFISYVSVQSLNNENGIVLKQSLFFLFWRSSTWSSLKQIFLVNSIQGCRRLCLENNNKIASLLTVLG